MANLITHYKEIDPLQTVKNVQNFFNSNGFSIIQSDHSESEVGTWSVHLKLYNKDDNISISSSNGKGMTREYALASGYAELYERFCNGMNFGANPFWLHFLIEKNKNKYGYSFRKDEKELTYQEAIAQSKRLKLFIEYMTHNDPELTQSLFDYVTRGTYIGVPMHNIADENDIMYMDPRMLLRILRSNGMCAGNTIDEALNQGISEICERYAEQNFFRHINDDNYYALKLEEITNKYLLSIINKIKELNYDIYILDLSINYEVPAVMSILIDKSNGLIHLNFGSFPVLDIAIERVLTELYQNVISYHDPEYLGQIQIPYKQNTIDQIIQNNTNRSSGTIFPENFFKNIHYVSLNSKNIFIEQDNNNQTIKKYYCDLAQRHNWKYYYMNNSLSKDIVALHVICEQDEDYENTFLNLSNIKDPIIKLSTLNLTKKIIKLEDSIITNTVDYINLIDIIKQMCEFNNINTDYFGIVQLWNFLIESDHNGIYYDILLQLIYFDIENIYVTTDLANTAIFQSYKCFQQLKLYKYNKLYTNDELLYIFNKLFNYNISLQDIEKCSNPSYLLKKAYVEPLHNYITGKRYNEIIEIFSENPIMG